jgi:hypothetical protein
MADNEISLRVSVSSFSSRFLITPKDSEQDAHGAEHEHKMVQKNPAVTKLE